MKRLFFIVFLLLICFTGNRKIFGQDQTVTLTADMFDDQQVIWLGSLDGWLFKPGNNPDWADPDADTGDWKPFRPADLSFDLADENGLFHGWFRLKFRIDSTLADIPLGWRSGTFGAMDLYLDGNRIYSYGNPDSDPNHQKNYRPYNQIPDPAIIEIGREYLLAFYLADHHSARIARTTFRDVRLDPWIRITGPEYNRFLQQLSNSHYFFNSLWITALTLLSFLFWFISIQAKKEYSLRLIAWLNTLLLAASIVNFIYIELSAGIFSHLLYLAYTIILYVGLAISTITFSQILNNRILPVLKKIFWGYLLFAIIDFILAHFLFTAFSILITISISVLIIIKSRQHHDVSQRFVIGGLFLTILWMFIYALIMTFIEMPIIGFNILLTLIYLTLPLSLLIFISIRYQEILLITRKNAREIVQLSKAKLKAEKEKQTVIESQKELLEKEVIARTRELSQSLDNLKAAQDQLVQQEKLASLGQLTAGIAHEIKNPLNFVNNFSEVSLELVEEAREEVKSEKAKVKSEKSPFPKGIPSGEGGAGVPNTFGTEVGDDAISANNEASSLILEILDDIEANLRKIHEHGSRADGIVKSMLQHSRGGDGKIEPTTLNPLVKEYVNLSFHGMKAGKDPIDVDIQLDLDETIGNVPLIAEDFSRVILNLCNNAFDAMRERLNSNDQAPNSKRYNPKLTVRTTSDSGKVTIEIEDNGPGIPDEIKDKILQPFFTTKKGTQGTGLGLSITNDIVKAHGGTLSVKSGTGEGSLFTIKLPVLENHENI